MASPPSYSLKLAGRLVTILFRVNLESCLQLIFIQTHTVTTYVFLPLSFPLLSAAIFHEVSSLRNNAVTVHPLNSKSGKRDFLCSDKRQYSSQSKERERALGRGRDDRSADESEQRIWRRSLWTGTACPSTHQTTSSLTA